MKTIVLTGHLVAQEAAELQVQILIEEGDLHTELQVRAVGASHIDAHDIHDAGGEIWHCGPGEPRSNLVGLVDRTLPATTFDDMRSHVVTCLAEFIAKTHIAH